ncbi:MAG: YggS family pyridoxal phosphate-dependent enzyme [Kofleriaceae bacterium]
MSAAREPEGGALAARWAAVRARVRAAAERAGRDPDDVILIAVSKNHPVEAVAEAVAAGARDLGENYVQELVSKRAATAGLAPAPRWHFIGRLQRNKARLIAGQVELVHAVDSLALARELGKRATAPQPVLLAVNVAGEETKAGLSVAEALAQARELYAVPGLRWRGLMTMPPPAEDPEASRPSFAALAALRRRLEDHLGEALPVLSMGMSDDFEVAISEGATHVRIGTAIFGARAARPVSDP